MKKWFFGALVLLGIGAAFDLGLLMYAMYVFLGVMLVSRYLTKRWTDSIEVTRTANRPTAEIGESVTIVANVRNKGALRVTWLLIEDAVPKQALLQKPPRIKIDGKRTHLITLRGGGRKVIKYNVRFNFRGYYQFGPMLLESGDLFGLHRRYRVATEPEFILVYPKVIPVASYDISSRRPIGEIKLTHRLFEDPTRMAGVRLYQRGDPLNRIHWKATARTGELHSKQFEPSSLAGATFLLDFHESGFPGRGEPFRSETAVTLIASLANAVTLMGQQIGFVSNGRDAADRVREEGWKLEFRTREDARQEFGMLEENTRLQPLRIETSRGPEVFQTLLETLARLELSNGLTFPQLIAESLTRLPRDATVVAVLPDVTEETAVALGNLRRSGYAVTAILILMENEMQYADCAGRLMAQHIDVRHISDEAGIADFCSSRVLQGV